jgi:hypothetical protein
MELTVLAVPDCPNVAVLQQRLAEVLADWPGVTMQWRVIADVADAARWRMHGSPTLLVNGHDPFGEAGAGPAMACRMYRAADGSLDGAPSVAALRQALEQAAGLASPRLRGYKR